MIFRGHFAGLAAVEKLFETSAGGPAILSNSPNRQGLFIADP
jgi:hypothetical protein